MLDWRDAHVGFDAAVADLPVELRGRRPPGFAHSAWELLEHLRITQADILDFSRNPAYQELDWPADYWPPSPEPPSEMAWADSVAGFQRERAELKRLAADESVDLFAAIPHGSGQTHLREILLVADHTAYHVGQMVSLRRALGAWQE